MARQVRTRSLIQILLPMYGREGRRIPQTTFTRTARELTRAFGGLTAYRRAPAEGLWGRGPRAERDDIVIYEVMVDRLDRREWRRWRAIFEKRFRQEEIVVRGLPFEKL